MKVLLAELNRTEVRERLRPNAVAVLPVASTEQHGPHLPVSTDALIVSECARRAAERVAGDIPIVVAPTLAYGYSIHHTAFPGTMSLSVPTFITVLVELCEGLIGQGFGKVLILNGHGGNSELVQVAVRELTGRHEVVAAAATYWDVARERLEAAGAAQVGAVPGHSAGFETTCVLALRPELADLSLIPESDASQPGEHDARATLKGKGAMTAPYRTWGPPTGVWGDPALVRPELGPALVEAIVASLADLYVALSRTEGY
jgi:creatinine amidohydrolase